MKKVITTMIVGLFASAAFAQTPASPATAPVAQKPVMEKAATPATATPSAVTTATKSDAKSVAAPVKEDAAKDAKATATPAKEDAVKDAKDASGSKVTKSTNAVAKKHTSKAKRKTHHKPVKAAKPVSDSKSANTKVDTTAPASK